MTSRLARWLGGFLVILPLPALAADPAPTPTGEKTGLIPRKVLFGNPDRARPASAPTARSSAISPRSTA